MKHPEQQIFQSIRLCRPVAIILTFVIILFVAFLLSANFATAWEKPIDIFFKTVDADGNGLISETEWHTAMQKRLETIDTNHDGNISREELEKSKEIMRENFRNLRKR